MNHISGEDHQIVLGSDIYEGMSVTLVVNGLIENNNAILSLDATLCSDLHSSCLPDIQVFTDVRFPDPGPCRSGKYSCMNKLCKAMWLGTFLCISVSKDISLCTF